MGLQRACLAAAFVLATASTMGAGCGGAVTPLEGDGGGSGSSGGSSGSSSGGSSSSGAAEGGPVDATPALDAPLTPEGPVGPCQVDGVPCITSGQCCSNACVNSVCSG